MSILKSIDFCLEKKSQPMFRKFLASNNSFIIAECPYRFLVGFGSGIQVNVWLITRAGAITDKRKQKLTISTNTDNVLPNANNLVNLRE